MTEIFSMYWEIFLLLPIVSFALPHLGTHLLAREKSVETIVLSITSQTGLLISGVIFEGEMSLIFSLVMTVFIYFIMGKIKKQKESFFILLFIFFNAFNYWIITFFPFLESHYTRIFSGDIVTLTGYEFYLGLCIFLGIALFLFVKRKYFFESTINNVVFKHSEEIDFTLIYLLALVAGCFTLGSLFTLALLFIVPIILGLKNQLSFYTYLWITGIIATLGTSIGFSLSLLVPRMATVPTMALITIIISLLFSFILTFVMTFFRPKSK